MNGALSAGSYSCGVTGLITKVPTSKVRHFPLNRLLNYPSSEQACGGVNQSARTVSLIGCGAELVAFRLRSQDDGTTHEIISLLEV